jgi:hypothetical protein
VAACMCRIPPWRRYLWRSTHTLVVGLGLREKSLAPGSRAGDDDGYIMSF